ncbi:hypothetical protein CRG98_002789 [Punica granatum]|nr:hypothetical protein CRG98_002789 [Punica granatum]
MDTDCNYPILLPSASSSDPNSAVPQSLFKLHHNTVQGFYGCLVKVLPTIKAIFTSFSPLSNNVWKSWAFMVKIVAMSSSPLNLYFSFSFLLSKMLERENEGQIGGGDTPSTDPTSWGDASEASGKVVWGASGR